MTLFITDRLRQTVTEFGDEGARWLAALPEHVAELQRAWSITVEPALETDGQVSWIAPARLADGTEAILKVSIPHSEARREADALRAWDGRGAVRLLRATEDGFSLLLERCVPGTNLWSLSEDEADATGAAVLRRLWREPPPGHPFDRLTDLAAHWCDELPRTAPPAGYDTDVITDAVSLASELAATQPCTVLLHGDYHPSNVLAAAREPWLAIDCKPLVGDPAYDLAQWLGNRQEAAEQTPNPVATLRGQIDRFAERLELDPTRIAGWAFVKSLGWEWGPSAARLFHAVLTA